MSSIDERIVEMQFDNAEFEKNINESIQSLEKLKKSLKIEDSGEAFQNIQNESKKVDFSHIEDGLDALNRRFSTIGIIGMQVIQSLTQEAIRLGGQLINAVTAPIKSDIVQGGWTRAMNLEQAKFQLEGLGHDAESVAHIMRNVDTAVSGTAYGLDEAALVASQLAASGIQAGESMGQLEHALLAVSGMAAMTGKSYGEIGHIMTTIAGNGRLMGMQLTQFSTYGLNVAAELAKSLGKTEGQIRDMVSKGAIDFTTFSEAMFNAYAKHAKNANKTLTGSISNVHAALKKIGQDFMTPLVENEGALTKVLNTIRLAINEVRNLTKPFADNVWSPWIKGALNGFDELINKFAFFRDVRPVEKMYDTLEKAGLSAKSFRKMLFEIGKSDKNLSSYKILSEFKTYEEFIDHYGNFRESLKAGWLNSDVIQAALKALNGETSATAENTAKLNEEYETLKKLVAEVWRGDWGNGAERVKKMNAAGLDYAKIQALVNKCEKGRALTLEDLDDKTLENVGVTKEQVKAYTKLKKKAEEAGVPVEDLIKDLYRPSLLQSVGTIIGNILGTIIDLMRIVKESIEDTFNSPTFNTLSDFLFEIYKFSFSLRLVKDNGDYLTKTGLDLKMMLSGLLSVLKVVMTFVGNAVVLGAKILLKLAPIGQAILDIFGALGQVVSTLNDLITESGIIQSIFKALEPVFSAIADVLSNIAKTISSAVIKRLNNLTKFFRETKDALNGKTGVSEGARKFAEALTKIKDFVTNAGTKIAETIGKIVAGFQLFFDTFKKNPEVERFVKNIQNLFGSIDEFASDKASKIGGIFEKIFGKGFKFKLPSIEEVANFFAGLLDPINNLLEGKGFNLGELFDGAFKDSSKAGINFTGILEGIITTIETIIEKLALFGTDAFSKLFGDFNWAQVVDVASILSFVYLIKVVADYCKKIPAVNIFTQFSDTLGNLSDAINAYKEKLKYENIKAIALSVAALAGVIYILGTMRPEQLMQGALALTLIAVILYKLIDILKKKTEIENLKDKIDKSVVTLRLGAAFLMMAAGVFLIIKSFKAISDMASTNMKGLLIGVVFVGVALAGIVAAFWALKKLKVEELTKGSFAFVSIAMAIGIIALALGLLTKCDPNNLIPAAIALAGVILALMVLVKAMGKAEPKKMIAASASMILVSVAISMLAVALAALNVIKDQKKLVNTLKILGGILAGLTISLLILGQIKPASVLAGAAAMILLATALGMMIPIFTSMMLIIENFKPETIGLALLGLIAILGIFIGAGALASLAAPGLLALSLALIAFGAGALLTAESILVLAAALPALAAGLAVMGTIIKEKAPEIGLAIATIIGVIAVAVSGSIPKLIEIAGGLIVAFAGGLTKAIPFVTKAMGLLIVGLLLFLLDQLPVLAEILVKMVISLIDACAGAVLDHGDELTAAVGNLLKSVVYLIGLALIELLDFFAGWLDPFGLLMDQARGDWKNTVDDWFTDIDQLHALEEEALKKPNPLNANGVTSYARKSGQSPAKEQVKPGTSTNEQGNSHKGGSIDSGKPTVDQNGVKRAEEQARVQAEAESDAYNKTSQEVWRSRHNDPEIESTRSSGVVTPEQTAKNNEVAADSATESVNAYFDSLKTGFENGDIDYETFMANIQNADLTELFGSEGYNSASIFDDKFKETLAQNGVTGEELFDLLGLGGAGGSGTAANPLIKPAVDFDARTMSNAWKAESNGTVKPIIKTEASGWANAARNEGAWQSVGRNNVQGLIRGMQSGLSAVAATARSIAESALNAAKAKLEQASPSKAFYRMGVYNDQGLINGMLFLRGKVEDASANVADSAINGAHYAIDRIKGIINSDMDMSPTIRPVFDDSLLQNGINTMSVWGNGYALNLAGSIGSVNLTQGQIFDDLNKRLDSRFEELSDRIDRISDRPFVANLTTTLDGREIAKGTATYTNEEMNRITRNNNRKAGRRG